MASPGRVSSTARNTARRRGSAVLQRKAPQSPHVSKEQEIKALKENRNSNRMITVVVNKLLMAGGVLTSTSHTTHRCTPAH